IAAWFPALVDVPIASAALWMVIGFDVCILILFVGDGVLAHRVFRVHVRRERPARLSLGAENDVSILLDNAGYRRLHIRVRDEAPPLFRAVPPVLEATVPARGWARLSYRLLPTDRGNFSFGAIHVRCRGILGLAWIDKTLPAAESVQVYPNLLEVRR